MIRDDIVRRPTRVAVRDDEIRLVEPDAALLVLGAGRPFTLQLFALPAERVALASLAFAASQFR